MIEPHFPRPQDHDDPGLPAGGADIIPSLPHGFGLLVTKIVFNRMGLGEEIHPGSIWQNVFNLTLAIPIHVFGFQIVGIVYANRVK